MYVLAENQAVVEFPYSFEKLRKDNPNTSFPVPYTTELLEAWGVYEVAKNRPEYDYSTHYLVPQNPTWDSDLELWVEEWDIVERSDAEKNKIAEESADYDLFHKYLLGSETYQIIKQQASTDLAVTVACTEFIAALTDAKYGTIDRAIFQACLENIVSATELSDENLQHIQRLLNLSKLGVLYSVWEGELPALTGNNDSNPAGGN